MRKANGWSALGRAAAISLGLGSACGKSNDPPPAQPFAPAAPAASPAVVTPAAAVAPAATLSQPSPFALPCQSDAQCLTHRCNASAGKCAWPCQSDTDCIPGNACIAPTCLPKLQ